MVRVVTPTSATIHTLDCGASWVLCQPFLFHEILMGISKMSSASVKLGGVSCAPFREEIS
jgi:hypothetical protein